jgi:AraC-like DNA-binding protein
MGPESLASEASMSRSAFAARFTELVGESAMRYVPRWRMSTALVRLAERNLTVAAVVNSLGYESEAQASACPTTKLAARLQSHRTASAISSGRNYIGAEDEALAKLTKH